MVDAQRRVSMSSPEYKEKLMQLKDDPELKGMFEDIQANQGGHPTSPAFNIVFTHSGLTVREMHWVHSVEFTWGVVLCSSINMAIMWFSQPFVELCRHSSGGRCCEHQLCMIRCERRLREKKCKFSSVSVVCLAVSLSLSPSSPGCLPHAVSQQPVRVSGHHVVLQEARASHAKKRLLTPPSAPWCSRPTMVIH